MLQGIKSRVSGPAGIVSGVTSRSRYVWVGATCQRYAGAAGDRRNDLPSYTFAHGYRPASWRKDKGWDWRAFGECTGERLGVLERARVDVSGSRSNQVFVGPAVLGVYKNYAVSGGVQWAAYQDVGLSWRRYPGWWCFPAARRGSSRLLDS